MNFKEELKLEARHNKEPTIGSLRTYFRDDKRNPLLIYWNSENNEFEYIYDGNKTMWRSLKFKGMYGNVSTPKIVKQKYFELISDGGL